jgi:hypothetical protein
MGGDAAIEFFPLGVGKLKYLRGVHDAVPEIFD